MDSDLWISRLMAAKRQYAQQRAQHHHATTASHHDRFGYDDIEPEDEVRPDFPCPYCYEDHDITSLCAHLEDEHPFESKVVACPVCSARISKDLLDHITLQHGYLFKLQRHHRLHRVALPSNNAIPLAGRDLQETYLKKQKIQQNLLLLLWWKIVGLKEHYLQRLGRQVPNPTLVMKRGSEGGGVPR